MQVISRGRCVLVVGKRDISHRMHAVQQKGGNVQSVRGTAILLPVAKLTAALNLKRRETRPKNATDNKKKYYSQTNQVEGFVEGNS